MIIKDNENYRELAEGIQHELISPRDAEGQPENESGDMNNYHDSIKTNNLNIWILLWNEWSPKAFIDSKND